MYACMSRLLSNIQADFRETSRGRRHDDVARRDGGAPDAPADAHRGGHGRELSDRRGPAQPD